MEIMDSNFDLILSMVVAATMNHDRVIPSTHEAIQVLASKLALYIWNVVIYAERKRLLTSCYNPH